MINMAVVNLKDIIKYFIKITLFITIVIGIIKYFSHIKNNVSQRQIITTNFLVSCLNTTVPGISSLNNEEKENTSIEPLEFALGVELEMLSSISNEIEESTTIETNNTENVITSSKEEDKNIEEKEVEANKKQEIEKVEQAETGLKTEVQSSNVPNKYTVQYNGVKIKNETEYELTEKILTPNININKNNILIYHTHSCESYTASEKYQYKQTGNFRTTDKNYSVIRVGKELNKQLLSYGYNSIHDETLHDYPSYSGSYNNSLKTVTKLLEENENTDITIDIHRDAIGDSTYAPTVKIGDEYAAQLMFVIGGNGSSVKHENWQQNLKFAIKVQEKANELYPGLFRPMILRYSAYNQHVAKAATLIEVGATGNTMEQSLVSMKYLAKVLDEVLK